jgi:predicted hydrocarbon binding protein
MFAGWFAGAMDWVLDTSGAGVKTYSGELQCGSQGHSHCLFRVRPQS